MLYRAVQLSLWIRYAFVKMMIRIFSTTIHILALPESLGAYVQQKSLLTLLRSVHECFSVRTWRKDSIFAHSMRYLTSDIVFTSIGSPILNGVLVVDHSGIIVDVLRNKEGLMVNVRIFEGDLCQVYKYPLPFRVISSSE